MAVKVINRKYNEIFTDGDTDWLLGNVGDWQKATIKVEVGIEFFATQQQPVSINTIENAFVLGSGQNWSEFGFDIGMAVVLSYDFEEDTTGDGNFDQIQTVQDTFNILNLYGDTMEVDGTIDVQGFENIPTNFGTKRITNVQFFVDQDPEGCRMFYGHLTNENAESSNLNSIIDGSETQFVFPNFDSVAQGQFVNMEPVGLQSGMSIKSARVRKLGTSTDGEELPTWDIPQHSQALTYFSPIIGNDNWNTIRSVLANISNNNGVFQSSTSSGLLGQSQIGTPNDANQNQCLLFNASQGATKEFFFNLDLRITDTSSIDFNDGFFRVSVLRFTNGSSFDFVEEIVLRNWSSPRNLINSSLTYNGTKEITYNATDSLVLVVKYEASINSGFVNSLTYSWNQGLIVVGDPGQIGTGSRRIFEFEIKFMISSIFDSVLNFEDLNNLQPPSYLIGDGSLTDNFRFEFYPEWNNPNVSIQNDLTKTARLGNTGWFNENFNELTNNFEVESIEYFDENGNPVDSLDYTAQTKVKAVIVGVPNLGPNTECGFGFAWIPIDEDDVREKETPFYRNIFVQSGDTENGFPLDQLFPGPYFGAGINGASMDTEGIKFTESNGKIIFEATFNPNGAFFTTFDAKDEADRTFILWVSVADGNLERNFSDRVSLLVDVGQMVKNIPPAGPYGQIELSFLEHPLSENAIGVSLYQGIVQDDVLARIPFKIPTNGSEVFQRITFGIEAFNIGDQESFELERYEVDLSQFAIQQGVQQFNFNQTRGFKLPSGNNKNWVKVQRDPNGDDSNFIGYLAFYAFKIRWEDWIGKTGVPGDFFDQTEENDGFHNDWIHYLRTNNWAINFFTEIVSDQNDELVEYRNQWPFQFLDYDENQNIDVTHQYFRNSDDTLLNIGTDPETGRPLGVILSNEETRIEINFDILDDGQWDISNTYAVTTIEIDRGPGLFEMRQISSVWTPESDNPLKPVSGSTKLKMTVDPTLKQLKTTCLVDPNLLENAVRYRITGRVGCFDDGNFVPVGLYESKYQSLYE